MKHYQLLYALSHENSCETMGGPVPPFFDKNQDGRQYFDINSELLQRKNSNTNYAIMGRMLTLLHKHNLNMLFYLKLELRLWGVLIPPFLITNKVAATILIKGQHIATLD